MSDLRLVVLNNSGWKYEVEEVSLGHKFPILKSLNLLL